MIDIKQIRENPEKFKAACEVKGFDVDIHRLLEIESELRIRKQALQDISTNKNKFGKSIPELSGDEKQSALARLSELKRSEAEFQTRIKELQPEFDELMLLVPQPPDEDVPKFASSYAIMIIVDEGTRGS